MKGISLRIRMVLVFVTLVAISIGAKGTVSHFYSQKMLYEGALNKLIAVRNVKKAQIENYFSEKTKDIKGMADTVQMVRHEGIETLSVIRDLKKSRIESYFQTALHELEAVSDSLDATRLFAKLKEYHDMTGVKPDGPYDVMTPDYDAIYTEHGEIMYRLLAAVGF